MAAASTSGARALAPVSARYGAPMGRACRSSAIPAGTKFYLGRLWLDRGGYEAGAPVYWGLGEPLFRAVSEDGQIELFFRARDREAAKYEVRRACIGATFFR